MNILGVALVALLALTDVSAHGQAKGIVLDRHNLMVDIRDANKVIRNMVRAKAPLDRGKLKEQSALIVERSRSMMKMFPDTKASRHGKGSNAKQTIWSDWTGFSQWNDRMGERAAKLGDMAASATLEELKAQHGQLGKTCSGCHKAFRTKKGL